MVVLGLHCSAASMALAARGDVTTLDPEFMLPFDVAIDNTGSIFVSDLTAKKIFTIGSDGAAVVLAGTGASGSQDGSAKIATFQSPLGLVADSKGNILVVDEGNRSIRKVSRAGVVSTLAGQADPAVRRADGQGPEARFGGLGAIAMNSSGEFFVSDDNFIRKITPSGLVTTLPLEGLLGSIGGLVFDQTGNLYVSDAGNHRIIKIAVNGVPSVFAGEKGSPGFAEGKGSSARFDTPYGLAVDSLGNILVSDVGNRRIRKIAKDGTTSTLAGSGTRGSANANGLNATFTSPGSIAVDSLDNVYVCEDGKHIRKIEGKSILTSLAGSAVVKAPVLAQVGNLGSTTVIPVASTTAVPTTIQVATTLAPPTIPPTTIAGAAPAAATATTTATTVAPFSTIVVPAPVPLSPASPPLKTKPPAKRPGKKPAPPAKKTVKKTSAKTSKKTVTKSSKKTSNK